MMPMMLLMMAMMMMLVDDDDDDAGEFCIQGCTSPVRPERVALRCEFPKKGHSRQAAFSYGRAKSRIQIKTEQSSGSGSKAGSSAFRVSFKQQQASKVA